MDRNAKIFVTLFVLGIIFSVAGLACGQFAILDRYQRLEDAVVHLSEVIQQDQVGVIQVFETPDHRWQIRVARPVGGLFEIVPIDPENPPGGQPIGQKPGI